MGLGKQQLPCVGLLAFYRFLMFLDFPHSIPTIL